MQISVLVTTNIERRTELNDFVIDQNAFIVDIL